ncbi:MAG: 2'-5' RNA ligase family protein [bacterium]|nr:2'-5' RNA ligase family protein [bacterium]
MSAKHLIAIPLPAKESGEIAQIYRQHCGDRAPRRIGPHITLIYPFRVDVGKLPLVNSILAEAAAAVDPLAIELDGIDCFENKEAVIYAKVSPNNGLTILQSRLMRQLAPSITFQGEVFESFHPHVTLAKGLSQKERESLFGELQSLHLRYRFQCDWFCLYQLNQSHTKWEEMQAFPLSA